MGNVYAKGIGEEKNPVHAYHFYLQADYAAKLRAKKSDFFGNTTVVMNIQKALEETRSQLPADFHKKYQDFNAPYMFSELAENRFRCKLNKEQEDNGDIKLTALRTASKAVPEPDSILVTSVKLGFCKRTTGLTMAAVKPDAVWFKDDSDTLRYDCCDWNYDEDRFEFYYDDELTGWIKCSKYRVFAPDTERPSGNEYQFASIRFTPDGRSYDYLCEIEDVEPGDTVIVNGYDGETEVVVTNVFTKYESELGLPIERFKKVLRRL